MAAIELRNATVRVKDGYSNAGAVNNMAGYAAGVSTMTIDGVTGTLALLSSFYVDGDPVEHIVTARSGGPPTTSITFTPALTEAVVNDAPITFGGRTLEVKIGDGNLTYTENRDLEYRLDRGNLDTVRELDQQPMDVTMDFIWEFITASTGDDPTLEDALKQRGEASGWTSSSSDQCEPYAVDIEIEYLPPCSDENPEVILLPDFRWDTIDHNLTDATLTATGRCNATQATVSRPTA